MRFHAYGFTLVEGLAAASAIVMLIVLAMILMPRPIDRGGHRTPCAANLSRIHKALYTYSINNNDEFPIAGTGTPTGSAIGFREGNRATGTGAVLENNVTASLWMMVRDGSLEPKHFICHKSGDVADPLTDDGSESGDPVSLSGTRDFYQRENLSYSMINMYHTATGGKWSSNAPGDWVYMSDNNNNDYSGSPPRHTLSWEAEQADVERAENSKHHSGEGQAFLFDDGHVEFLNNPFAGPGDDNVFAMTRGGENAPPTLGNSDGDAASDPDLADTDVVLLPLTGNGGGAGSLDPTD